MKSFALAVLIILTMATVVFADPAVSPTISAINWTAPTTNTDGSKLTDLTGYKVYYCTPAAPATTCSNFSDANGSTDVGLVNTIAISATKAPKQAAPQCATVTAYNSGHYESAFATTTAGGYDCGLVNPVPFLIPSSPGL